jgi:hypothetical protein
MPGAVKLGAGLALRLVCSRAPYGRAGVRFEPSPDRVYGVVEIGVDDLLDGAITELLADPYVDVSIGPPGSTWRVPVVGLADFESVAQLMKEQVADLLSERALLDKLLADIDVAQLDTLLADIPEADAWRRRLGQSRDGGQQGDEEAPNSAGVEAGAEPADAVDTPPPETPAPVTDAAPAAGFDPSLPEGALKPVINIDELLPPDERAKMLADATAANKAATKPAKPKK